MEFVGVLPLLHSLHKGICSLKEHNGTLSLQFMHFVLTPPSDLELLDSISRLSQLWMGLIYTIPLPRASFLRKKKRKLSEGEKKQLLAEKGKKAAKAREYWGLEAAKISLLQQTRERNHTSLVGEHAGDLLVQEKQSIQRKRA